MADEMEIELTPEQEQAIRDRNDLKQIMELPGGRRFVWRILSACHPYRPSMAMSYENTAYQEGQRSIGLWLIDALDDVDVSLYPGLMLERKKDQDNDDQ